MKTVDFTKKIVCSDETIKVVQVISVTYMNNLFNHLVIYEDAQGYQNVCAVNDSGEPSLGSSAYYNFTFSNPEPKVVSSTYRKVVSSTYRNVYHSGFIGKSWPTREAAEKNSDTCRSGILETLKFDDGASKVKFIEV